MNGATEATLQELLQIAQQQLKAQGDLKKFFEEWKRLGGLNIGNSGGAGAGGGMAGAALGAVSKAAGPLSLAFGALGVVSKLVSGAFDLMASIVGKVVEGLGKTVANLIEFGFQAMQGSTSVAKFVDAFKDLPFFLGTLASLFAKVIAYEEDVLKSYQSISKTGSILGSNLFDLSQAAFRSYMSIDELTGIIKEYGSVFASASGGVDQGIKKFTDTQHELMGPQSPFRKDLLGLGFTFKDMAEYGALFMAMQTNSGRLNSMTSKEQAAAVANLAKETDMYVKLSGQQREEVEKQMKQQAFDNNIKRFLQSLNPEQMKVAQAKLAKAQIDGGQGLYEQVAGTLMGLKGPVTDAAAEIYVQTRGASVGYAQLALAQVKAGKETAEGQAEQLRLIADGTDAFDKSLGGANKTGQLALTGVIRISAELSKTANMQRERTLQAGDAIDLQKKQMEGLAGKLADAQAQIKFLGSAIGGFLVTILAPFGNALTKLTGGVLTSLMARFNKLSEPGGPLENFAKTVEEWVEKHMKPIINWFIKAFDDLSNVEPGKFWETLKKKLGEGLDNVWQVIKPTVLAIWDDLKPILKTAFTGLLDLMWEAFKEWLAGPDPKKLAEEGQKKSNAKVKEAVVQSNYKDQAQSILMADQDRAKKEGKPVTDITKADIENLAKQLDPNKWDSEPATEVKRATGSWGTTGKLIENFGNGTKAELHGNEGVITSDQLNQLMAYALKSGGENKLGGNLERLNMQMGQLIAINKEQAEYIRKNVDATKGLHGNLFT